MANISRYLKIVKEAEIEPEESIEDRIMDRISNIKEEDREEILDKNFREFLKNSNSRAYQFEQKVRSHPGLFAMILAMVMGAAAILAYIAKLIISAENK